MKNTNRNPLSKRRGNPPGKETTKRVATDASRLLAFCRAGEIWFEDALVDENWKKITELAERVAASCLVQKLPEPGKRKRRRGKGRARK